MLFFIIIILPVFSFLFSFCFVLFCFSSAFILFLFSWNGFIIIVIKIMIIVINNIHIAPILFNAKRFTMLQKIKIQKSFTYIYIHSHKNTK